jgi:hypothetical protein
MSGAEIIQFIPKARTNRETDFPVIVFKGPIAPANAHENALYDYTPSEFVAPEQDPA